MYLENLQELCRKNIETSFPLHSRVHRMQEGGLFVKREDELGFGISGSKLRKYVSILPVVKRGGKKVGVIGSLYSNHVLSLVQLLKQEGIEYELFLEKPKTDERKGNAFFLSLLIREDEVTWIEKGDCSLARDDLFWIPMGGCMKEALSGSLTLALDIVQNEKDLGLCFDRIFVDAGTGMSAMGLILGMSYLRKEVKVEVVLIAGNQEEFDERLKEFHGEIQELMGDAFPLIPYRCLFPVTAKSFGSHNRSIFQMIKKTAEKEGFFLDPLYTAKLLMTTQEVIKKEALEGNILWIHSGGALSLAGFQEASLYSASSIT